MWSEPPGKGQTGLKRQELRGNRGDGVCVFSHLPLRFLSGLKQQLQRPRAGWGKAWHGYFCFSQAGRWQRSACWFTGMTRHLAFHASGMTVLGPSVSIPCPCCGCQKNGAGCAFLCWDKNQAPGPQGLHQALELFGGLQYGYFLSTIT